MAKALEVATFQAQVQLLLHAHREVVHHLLIEFISIEPRKKSSEEGGQKNEDDRQLVGHSVSVGV